MLRITRQFTFHMAHAIDGYDGLCANIHGHEYVLQVTVAGDPDADGMVIDFKKMKQVVQSNVLDYYDHSLLLKSSDKTALFEQGWNNVHIVAFQPSSENIITDIVARLRGVFPVGVSLFSLRLCETSGCWVEWYASEN